MGTHLIPRSNVKGQDRFFIVFSIPGLIGTIIGLIPGWFIYSIIKSANHNQTSIPGLVVAALFGFIGFIIGQGKIPDTGNLPIIKKVGGLYVRDVITSFFNFRANKKKYVLQVSENQAFDESTTSKTESFLLNRDFKRKNQPKKG